MKLTPVESSHIEAIGYEDSVLTISFLNGSIYEYYDVPERVFRELMAAPSKGIYLKEHIKKKYKTKKV